MKFEVIHFWTKLSVGVIHEVRTLCGRERWSSEKRASSNGGGGGGSAVCVRQIELFRQLTTISIRKNIFACLFSVHNTISLSRQEQLRNVTN